MLLAGCDVSVKNSASSLLPPSLAASSTAILSRAAAESEAHPSKNSSMVNHEAKRNDVSAPVTAPGLIKAGELTSRSGAMKSAVLGLGAVKPSFGDATDHLPVDIDLLGLLNERGDFAPKSLTCINGAITVVETDRCTVSLNSAARSGGMPVIPSSNSAPIALPSTITTPANATIATFASAANIDSATQKDSTYH
jgi:hypothetical protein